MSFMQYQDQIGNRITLDQTPGRVVSVVPSQTEFLVDLGLRDQLAGVTKFCVHPRSIRKQTAVVGGTKKLHVDKILKLAPDLVIANKEENTPEDIQYLMERVPVYVSDVPNLSKAFEMMRDLGRLMNKQEEATQLVNRIAKQMPAPKQELKKALYLIWRKPYMTIGHDTFIHDMMTRAGFENVMANQTRYPMLEPDEIKSLNPRVILLSSEPYPFKGKHLNELAELCPEAEIKLVDGELFSWYGSRLLYTGEYFKALT